MIPGLAETLVFLDYALASVAGARQHRNQNPGLDPVSADGRLVIPCGWFSVPPRFACSGTWRSDDWRPLPSRPPPAARRPVLHQAVVAAHRAAHPQRRALPADAPLDEQPPQPVEEQ